MKIYKGMELFEKVSNLDLNNGTKLRCIHHPTYGQGVEVDGNVLIWSDTKEPVAYAHFKDRAFEFEIIEEKPKHIEEINKSYPIFNFDKKSFEAMKDMLQDVYSKQVKIIKSVNYLLDKEENEQR